jgi:N-acetylglucosaminyldiphosphoundecaprenol N-acetyl-beta-D-mannosaminyltransferase
MEKAFLLNVGVDLLDQAGLIQAIAKAIGNQGRLLIMHTNIRGLNLAYEQPWLREVYNQADLVYCDGMGVMLGAYLLGEPVPPRSTLADWVWPLAAMCAENSFSVFLLGNPPGTAEKAAAVLTERYASLKVAGTQHGFFDLSPESQQNAAMVKHINSLKPDLLLVGFGMPLQERWLSENWPRLDVHVAITCGALFEMLTGDLKRGPKWMTDHYLEWLTRIIISPKRVFRRYLRDIPLFYFRILRQRLDG